MRTAPGRNVVGVMLLVLSAITVARADATDDYVKAQLESFHLPGLSLVVVKNGEVIKAQGYGVADVERKLPATPETIYKIGSVSKQFVATGVMLLVQDGRLGLDDPISKFFEGLPAAWQAITVRHLLTHTSGLIRECPGFDPMKSQTDAELIKSAYPAPLRFTPGEKWEYSNTGYYVLAEIIRRVTGQPWTDYLHSQVFAPSGMASTFATNTSRQPPTRAVGYTGNDNQQKADEWVALRPSGAFLSTVLDLAKWDAVLYGDRILSEQSRQTMWTPVRLNDGTSAPYGFGWHIHAGKGTTRVWHGGGLPGFTAHFARFVEDRLTVIALTNGNDVDLYAIVSGVATRYRSTPQAAGAAFGVPFRVMEWPGEARAVQIHPQMAQIPPIPPRSTAGRAAACPIEGGTGEYMSHTSIFSRAHVFACPSLDRHALRAGRTLRMSVSRSALRWIT